MENADVRERFVGREAEIAHFKEWLTGIDPESPWILYLYDMLDDPDKKGGVGKTWLLRKFSEVAKETQPDIVTVYIDFFNITDRDGAVVAERVVAALKEAYPTWDISNFEKNQIEYNSALRESQEDVAQVRNRFADALINDLHTLDEQLGETRKRLLLFFDTYERIEENPLSAALRLDQAFPDDYAFSQIGVVVA